jgi:hypothetical protein
MEMTTTKSTSIEIEDIQRRMAQIRHEMHGEVLEAVKGAQSLTDWRSLVRNHPWLTVGVATAVGYLLVPRRRATAPMIVAVNAPTPKLAALVEPQKPSANTGVTSWSVMGTAFSLLAPIAVRAAQNYAMQYIEGLLARHEFPPTEAGRRGRPAENGARPGAPLGPSGRLRQPS